ncbi:hypothetical protein [Nocardiopsis sp. CNR-923]|nr:hypothetical protein [Nocardiopsis sp. CNR-923]
MSRENRSRSSVTANRARARWPSTASTVASHSPMLAAEPPASTSV